MKFLFGSFLVAALSSGAFAQTISETENFFFVPSGSVVLTFNQFDTEGGTRMLTGIKITSSFTRTGGTLSVDNDSGDAGSITLTHKIAGSLSGAVPLLTSSFAPVINPSTFVAQTSTDAEIGASSGDSTGGFDPTGMDDYYVWAPVDAFVSQSGNIGSLFWTNYTGTGTFNLEFTGNQVTTATGTSGLQQGITVANLTGEVTVEYTYAPIPEPSTALLSALALSAAVLRRRRA